MHGSLNKPWLSIQNGYMFLPLFWREVFPQRPSKNLTSLPNTVWVHGGLTTFSNSIPFSPRRLCRGTAIASRPHVSSLSGLCSLVCSVCLVGYGVFKNTHKTHLDINGILNDIVYRCDITVKWVHVQCISLVSSICHTYKLWHKNNEIWIHGLLKTHETYIVPFYGFLNVFEGIVSTLPHMCSWFAKEITRTCWIANHQRFTNLIKFLSCIYTHIKYSNPRSKSSSMNNICVYRVNVRRNMILDR